MKTKLYKIWILILTFMKIGLFTFGGGYAMIPLIQEEVIEKHKWLSSSEMMDVIAIAESTPGPISVNTATYVGFKVAGVFGAIFSTLGLMIPSFIIIFVISLFYDQFMKFEIIQNMFLGIKSCVAFLIILGGYKLLKILKINYFSTILLLIVLIATFLLGFFNVDVSSIYFILGGAAIGLASTALSNILTNKKRSAK